MLDVKITIVRSITTSPVALSTVATKHLKSALAADEFAKLSGVVDPYIEAIGDLAAIVIETPSFPGWESLGAMGSRFSRQEDRRPNRFGVRPSIFRCVRHHGRNGHFQFLRLDNPARIGGAENPLR
jgi:hypothetical protein